MDRSIVLETARLCLRRFVASDLDLLVELDSDPQVMRYLTGGAPTPREYYSDVVLPRWFALYEQSPELGYWAAEIRETGRFVGWFHLRVDRFEPEYLELGYRFRRDAWGQGLATEGGRAVVRHGFDRASAEQVSARTLAANRASQRVMQKCGLRFAGTFEYGEETIPGLSPAERRAVKYVLTRREWLASQG